MRAIIACLLAAAALAGCTDAEPEVEEVHLTTVPEAASDGSTVEVCWEVHGAGDIGHTALHWGNESHTGEGVRFSDYPNLAWPGNEQQDSYSLPDTFCTTFTMPEEDVYLRGHAMIEAPGVVSDEAHIQVSVLT